MTMGFEMIFNWQNGDPVMADWFVGMITELKTMLVHLKRILSITNLECQFHNSLSVQAVRHLCNQCIFFNPLTCQQGCYALPSNPSIPEGCYLRWPEHMFRIVSASVTAASCSFRESTPFLPQDDAGTAWWWKLWTLDVRENTTNIHGSFVRRLHAKTGT